MSTNIFNPIEPQLVVNNYFKLVQSIACNIKRRLPAHVDVEDLVQTGMIGLLEASRRYDASRAVDFSSYANSRITGAILDELRKWDTCSRQDRRTVRNAEAAKDRLRATTGREPSREQVAQAVGIGLEEYERSLQRLESSKQPAIQGADQESDGIDPVDILPSKENSPSQSCIKREESRLLRESLTLLKPRHQEVLRLYYFEDMGLREIGERLGVGEARVSQLHRQALKELRKVSEQSRAIPAPKVSALIQ